MLLSALNDFIYNKSKNEPTDGNSRFRPLVLKYSVYLEEIYDLLPWQESFMAQPPQPQEQELLPFFLLRIPTITIARNITAIITVMIIVGTFIKKLLFTLRP